VISRTQEKELRHAVEVTRMEYAVLATQYERLMTCVHDAPFASNSMRRALRGAGELAPHVAMALRQYLDAVEVLTVFCHSTPPAGHRKHTTAAHEAQYLTPSQSTAEMHPISTKFVV